MALKAALKSNNRKSDTCSLSIFMKTSFVTFNNAVSVLWRKWYGDWSWGKKLFLVMWHWLSLVTTHSVNLDTNCKLLIEIYSVFEERVIYLHFFFTAWWSPILSKRNCIFPCTYWGQRPCIVPCNNYISGKVSRTSPT